MTGKCEFAEVERVTEGIVQLIVNMIDGMCIWSRFANRL